MKYFFLEKKYMKYATHFKRESLSFLNGEGVRERLRLLRTAFLLNWGKSKKEY